jgi:hypothetical protein
MPNKYVNVFTDLISWDKFIDMLSTMWNVFLKHM